MNEKQMYIETKRIAMHKATDLYEPFTKNWERAYTEILDKEWRALITPPAPRCCCRCCK